MEAMGEEKLYLPVLILWNIKKPLSGKVSQLILSLIAVCLPFTGLLIKLTPG